MIDLLIILGWISLGATFGVVVSALCFAARNESNE